MSGHWVVYAPKERGHGEKIQLKIFEAKTDLTDGQIEQAIANIEKGTKPGQIAYIRAHGETTRAAVAFAFKQGLTFIPPMITLGMRNRLPGVSMREIRTEFTQRVKAYAAPQRSPNPFEGMFRSDNGGDAFEDLFGESGLFRDGNIFGPGGPRPR